MFFWCINVQHSFGVIEALYLKRQIRKIPFSPTLMYLCQMQSPIEMDSLGRKISNHGPIDSLNTSLFLRLLVSNHYKEQNSFSKEIGVNEM